MENEIKKYEIISNTSSSLIIGKTIVLFLLFSIVLYVNSIVQLNKIWNFCFLFPVLITYMSSITLHIISVFKVGAIDNYNIENKNNHKSNIILASNIVFLATMFLLFIYFLLSIIIFA